MATEKKQRNKIGLLLCHSHIELRLIEVEVKLSWISLTSFRGQSHLFLRFFGPYLAIYGYCKDRYYFKFIHRDL